MAKLTAKQKKQNQLRKQTTKNLSSTERDGFTFVFDDVALQDEYMAEWNHFNTKFKGKSRKQLPRPNKITYQDAKSLVSGKNQTALTELESIYDQLDMTWETKGRLHKFWFFNEAIKNNDGTQEISNFVEDMDNYLDELAKQSGIENVKGSTRTNYNIVYYGIQNGGISV